jgi:hypothetical protein
VLADAERHEDAAKTQAETDHHGKDGGADLLTRHRREARAGIGGKRPDPDQHDTGHAVRQLHDPPAT